MLRSIDTKNETVVEITQESLLSQINLTKEQFLDVCIMCGTDFNKNMRNIGPVKALKLIREYKSIEGIRDNTDLDTSCLCHERVREIFTLGDVKEAVIPFCRKPDLRDLGEYNINLISNDMCEPDLVFD